MANNPIINHVLLPNNTTYDVQDDYAIESITRSGNTFTATRRNGTTFTFDQKDDNTTYTLTQSQSDAHSIIFTDSAGNSATITIPDANTTYTIEADTTNNQIKLVPSSGSAVPITVPFATNATNAVNATKATQDESGNNIKGSYAASMSVDTTTNKIQLKNKNGIVLSEIDAPSSGNNYTFAEGSTNGAFEVTPDGENTQVVTIHGLGTAAFANIVSTYSATGTAPVNGIAVAAALATLPTPMTFQGTLGENGTITALPTASASTVGYTYRVIKDGTYAGQAAKDGDEFIGAEIPKNSGTYVWVYIPSGDEPSGTVTNIATGTGLIGGPISTSGTISHADTSSQASVSNSGRTYIQSITLDGMGHVTGLSSATETVTNTDRYVNSATFADDTTANANSPVKMTLTRAGSDSATVIANIPKVSSSSAGVAPKGAAVSSQSQSTKFLREDGIWAAPSYTVNTDTKVTAVGNHYTPTADTSAQLSASASGGTAAWSIDVVQGVQLQRDAKGHVTGVSVTSGKIPANPNTDTKVTSVGNHYAPAEDSSAQLSADASSTTAATWNSTSLVTGVDIKRDAKGHVVGISVDSIKMPANPDTNNAVTQTASTGSANYEVLFSGTADNTTRTEGARKNSNLLFNPSTGNLQATQLNGVTIGDSPKFTDTNTWRGIQDNLTSSTNTTESLSAKQGYLLATGSARDSTKMPLAGGTFTGAVKFAGVDLTLGTGASSSDDSGDLVWSYGNDAEKMRLYAPNTPTAKFAPLFREFKSDGTSLYNGNLVLGDGTGASGTWGISISGNAATATTATKATQDESGNNIKATYSASMDKVDHRLRLMNKNGSVLSTVNITHSEPSARGNMNNVAAYGNSMGMISLSGTDTTINPNGQTGWHHFINMSYTINGQESNMWQTQIANQAGTTDLWVRSRSGSSITDGTAWRAAWTRILTGTNWSNVVTKSAIGLGNVENKSSATIRGEITSANVTTALGYTPVNKAGDTMSGSLHFSSSAPLVYDWVHTTESPMIVLKDSANYGIRYKEGDPDTMKFSASGNANTNNADLCINGAGDGTVTIRGNTIIHAGNYTTYTVKKDGTGASGTWGISISGNAATATSATNATNATNADKVDGYHVYYDRYVSSTQLAQPTADTIWYVKVSTANWNSNIEVIQIRTQGNNRTGSHVLYTGSRGTKWWGYGQVYSHRGLSGVYKVISNSDDIYLRFDADCTAATIYTSFTPQTIAIVDSPSGAYYTEVPTYGGWYGNQITVDHIQTNNYITIQKSTVASNTFDDTNPKIVFKNSGGSQSGSLTWNDYDSVQSPASLTLNGNQGGEYFIAPNIKATGSFYGNLSGNASTATSATTASYANFINLIASNEIRFGNKPSSAVDVYVNYRWADGTASAMINKYVFMNGNKTKCPVEASKFIGPLQGNADTATSATKATQDGDGNTIKSTYLKLAGGTLTGTLQLGSSTQSTLPTCGIHVHDVRSVDITTNCMSHQSNFFFSNRSMPDGNWWSLLHVKGWNENGYNTWELAGPANTGDQRSTPLYVRSSNGTTWGSWRKIFDSSNKPTKSDVGLGNVDNTADANKSVNYATSAGTATSATTANYLGSNTRMDYGWNGVNYFNISGTAGNAAKVNDTPTSAWWHIMRFNHANSSGYYTDLAIPFNATSLYYKRITGGTVQNNGWVKVLDALNYTNYTVTKTGTGASGSWGINITGSSASCTGNAATATTASNIVITTTNPSSSTGYNLPFITGTYAQAASNVNNGLSYYTKEGTTAAAGEGTLQLGNNTSTGTAGNKTGWLRLFSGKNGYAELGYTSSATSNTTHYLPTTGGTLLNSGTTSFTQTLTSGTKIGSIKINGTSTDMYAPSGGGLIATGTIAAKGTVTYDLTINNNVIYFIWMCTAANRNFGKMVVGTRLLDFISTSSELLGITSGSSTSTTKTIRFTNGSDDQATYCISSIGA